MPETFSPEFYDRDPREVAVDLLGCVLHCDLTDGLASGIIIETEAYRPEDPACHAYNGPTMRNRTLFEGAGVAYVYLSYGIHRLLNVVCEGEGVGSAVLIRALSPIEGIDLMRRRRGRPTGLCDGPGKLTQALGVDLRHDDASLSDGEVYISPGPVPDGELVATTRIGITRGTELPWRYLVLDDPNVSVRPRSIASRNLRRAS